MVKREKRTRNRWGEREGGEGGREEREGERERDRDRETETETERGKEGE